MLETVRRLGTFRGVSPEWREKLLAAVAARQAPTLMLWGDGT
jgi:hypothetical protein